MAVGKDLLETYKKKILNYFLWAGRHEVLEPKAGKMPTLQDWIINLSVGNHLNHVYFKTCSSSVMKRIYPDLPTDFSRYMQKSTKNLTP